MIVGVLIYRKEKLAYI